MGKIKKQFSSDRHGNTLSPYIADFVRTTESLPLHKFPSTLATFPWRWPFPRGDLYHWIPLLNRFDEILEHFNKIYALGDGPQSKQFGRELLYQGLPDDHTQDNNPKDVILDGKGFSAEGDREVVEAIVSFTQLLHENCGNRSLYASSGRLNGILNTSSLSLLEATLRLLHRLAQRYTAQRLRSSGGALHLGSVRGDILHSHYNVDLYKLEALASEPSNALPLESKLQSSQTAPSLCAIDHLFPAVSLDETDPAPEMSGEDVKEPDKKIKYELFSRRRSAAGDADSSSTRSRNGTIRLLAIANLAQILPEATLQEKALKCYIDRPRHRQLPQLLCELIRPPSNHAPTVPRKIQTIALLTLESLTNHKNFSSELTTALNVSVNHGPLASALRQAVTLITDDDEELLDQDDTEWMKELFELFHDLPRANTRAVEGIISAGLIDMLVAILKAKTPKAEKLHEAALRFLGLYIWNIQDALGSLVNAGGMDILSALLVHHIDRAVTLTKQGEGMPKQYKTQVTDYQIPFVQQQSLRAIFKFIHNMLGMTGGQFDRLVRNLLEASEVLASLRTVISNSRVFGSNVWTNCVHVFSTFINNEPTSYTAIAEAGIPTAILESIVQRKLGGMQEDPSGQSVGSMEDVQVTSSEVASESAESSASGVTPAGGILPACEAINAVPDSFGAMCLNENGLQQFQRSGALDTLFGVFLSPLHVRAFANTTGSDIERLGASLEQLHRHNPTLSTSIKELVVSTAAKVASLVANAPASGRILHEAHRDVGDLAHVSLSEDVDMSDTRSPNTTSVAADASPPSTPVSAFITVFTKFLAALFRNNAFCSHFTEKGGLDSLLQMGNAPGLLKDVEASKPLAPLSLHRFGEVIRYMVEQKPYLVLPQLIGRLRDCLGSLSDFINASPDGKRTDEESADKLVQALLLSLGLAKSLVSPMPHNPTRHIPPSPLTQVNVADLLCPLVDDISKLQRRLVDEQLVAISGAFDADSERSSNLSKVRAELRAQSEPVPAEVSRLEDEVSRLEDEVSRLTSASDLNDSLRVTLDRLRGNAHAASTSEAVAAGFCKMTLPNTIADLLAKISSTIVPRRLTTDNYQRQQVMKVGDRIAESLIQLLRFEAGGSSNSTYGGRRTLTSLRTSCLDYLLGPLLSSRHCSQSMPSSLQTVVVKSFMDKGGIAILGKHAEEMMELNVRLESESYPDQPDVRSFRQSARDVLERYISLLGSLSEKRAVTESQQTTALNSRERSELGLPTYFSANQFLVELRLHVMRAISPLWASDDLDKLQSAVIRKLSKVVQGLLEGSGESGAIRRSDRLAKPNPSSKTWSPRSGQLKALTDGEYSRELAEEALYRCNDNEAHAREYCLYYSPRPLNARLPPPHADIQPPPPLVEPLEDTTRGEEDQTMSTSSTPVPEPLLRDFQEGSEAVRADRADLVDIHPQLMDVLSDVANTILRDPSNAAHPATAGSAVAPPSEAGRVEAGETTDVVTIEDLDEERTVLRNNLMDRCLTLSGNYEDVAFEMADLIISSSSKAPDPAAMRSEVTVTLVTSLLSYEVDGNLQSEAKKLSGIAHLLGLILQEKDFFEAAKDVLKDNFSSLLALVFVPQGLKPTESTPWIPQVLLILERCLIEDVQPHEIEWTPPPADNPSKEQPIATMPEPMISTEEGMDLFKAVVDILPSVGKDLELGISLVRVLVVLTRVRSLAAALAQKPNMQKFLVLVKQLAPVVSDRLRKAVLLVFRHIVEDRETVRRLIASDIRELLERTRHVDTARYCKDLYHVALRDPELFVEVTNEICEILKIDRQPNPSGPQAITLKKVPEDKSHTDGTGDPKSAGQDVPSDPEVKPSAESFPPSEKAKVSEVKAPIVEHPDGVIHYLLCELLNYKDVEDKRAAPTGDESRTETNGDVEMTTGPASNTSSSASSTTGDNNVTSKEHFKTEDHPIFMYRCFILQVLVEMLGSYNRSKIEFINFSRKADPQAATPSKPRSGILNYVLNELLPTGTIEHVSDIQSKKNSQTSDHAIVTIVALCTRTTEGGAVKRRDTADVEDEPELAFVRRFVLEHALKAYKDCMSSPEPMSMKYSKLLALADLFNRMLAGRTASQPGYGRRTSREDNLEPSNKHIAKIMFEKNFTGALTTSMSDVDPKTPGANRLIKYILRPLKLLTHTAIELSLAGDPSTSPGTTTDDDEISSASSVSGVDDDREETPDLYRNSALGMFEPGREEDTDSDEDDGDDDEHYDDGYDEMDYDLDEGDEDADEGDVVSDDDEHMEDMGPMEGLPGDVGMDVEIELDDDHSGSDDEDEDEDDEDDGMDEDGEDDEDEDEEGDDEDAEDDDVEIFDEITGDNENDSLGDYPEDEDGEEYDGNGLAEQLDMDGPTFEEMLGQTLPPFPGDDEPSDVDVERYDPDGMDDRVVAVDMETGEGAGDLESAGEEDEDEDDYDDELMYHEAEDEDGEMPPFIFNPWHGTAGRRNAPPRFAPGRYEFTGEAPDPIAISDYRLAQPGRGAGAGRGNDTADNGNPLLNRMGRSTLPAGRRPTEASEARRLRELPPFASLLPRLEDLGPGSGDHYRQHYEHLTSLINALGRAGPGAIMPSIQGGHHHHHNHHNGGISIRLQTGTDTNPDEWTEFQIQAPPGHRLPVPGLDSMFGPSPRSNPAQAVGFQPGSTAERWHDEARLIFGSLHLEKALRLVNYIHRLLVPLAMAAENERKDKEAEIKKKQDEEAKLLEAEREQREERQRKAREEREARERQEAEAAAEAARQAEVAAGTNEQSANDTMEGVERADTAAEGQSAQTLQGESASNDRVYTNIRGSQLDITDLGIDAAYLEALPEDMREEVIMQQYTEHRSQAAASGTEPSAVDNEFLQALPEDIREEIIAQERQERRRRERQEQRRQAAAASGQPAQAEDMDPASFLTSLDPLLRQQVLAEADDDMIANLPPHIAAEARALGGAGRRRTMDRSRLLADLDNLSGVGATRERRPYNGDSQRQRRPIVQMLDKASVITLLRLMFLPLPGNARQTLNGILRNASGNHQTRSEVVSGLLQVLQDGSTDQGAIERSFVQMSNRAKQSTNVNRTPSKTKAPSAEPQLHDEATPRLVISNCLASLMFLTQSITHIPKFFLTEHEIVGGSKMKSKGKGKAKETKASKVPLNALLGLLDRQLIIDDTQLVEQLAGLLQTVTQPLIQLLKEKKETAATGFSKPEGTDAPAPSAESASAAGSADQVGEAAAKDSATKEAGPEAGNDNKKTFQAPEVPDETLRLVVNILSARDCGSKTFRDALSTINNLSSIPKARDVFGEELVSRARQLAKSIVDDLSSLTNEFNKATDAMEAQNMALTKFSPTGSDQSKLNRILTALDYLFDPKQAAQKKDNGSGTSCNDLMISLHEDPTFSRVWIELNGTLSAAHKVLAQGQQSDKTFLNVATILLPLVESLMVMSKRLDIKDARGVLSGKQSVPTTPGAEPTMKQIFIAFTNGHRKILNDLVRQNPKLMSGSFAVLIKNSSVLEFDNKRNYFNRRLHHRTTDLRQYPHATLGVNVRRDQVFTDSYRSLFFKKPEEMKYGKLNVRFHNEEGVDAGGVTREWFQVLSRQMFDANFALFNPVAADRTTFHPNPLSYINEEHIAYFQFIGRIIGKALYENRVLDCHFSRAVYKQLLGRQVSLKDMETIDLDYAKSLQWMLDNSITDIITETFSVTSDNFGVTEVIDLVPNGRNIPVTDENKQEYVRLVIEHKLTGSVSDQLAAFLKGFHDIVPAELVAIFDEGELELLISGLPDIDLFDWKSNTDYQNYNANSPQIQWFWRAVRSFDKEERAKLLQFITGTGKVPLNGFKELEGMNGFTRFSIHKDFGDKDRLPSSHTCFNQLDLPEYDTYDNLRKNLYTAMTTGGEYFGFA